MLGCVGFYGIVGYLYWYVDKAIDTARCRTIGHETRQRMDTLASAVRAVINAVTGSIIWLVQMIKNALAFLVLAVPAFGWPLVLFSWFGLPTCRGNRGLTLVL